MWESVWDDGKLKLKRDADPTIFFNNSVEERYYAPKFENESKYPFLFSISGSPHGFSNHDQAERGRIPSRF